MAFCLTLLKSILADLQDQTSNTDYVLLPVLEVIQAQLCQGHNTKKYLNNYLTPALLMST